MYKLGKEKYETDFDILKIIKAVRNFDNYYKLQDIKAEIRAKIEYSKNNNLLCLDTGSSDCSHHDDDLS